MKAQKEEAKIARQAEQQLKNDLRQLRRGKKKVITQEQASPEGVVKEVASEVECGPIPARSRRRQIQLPQRYRNT